MRTRPASISARMSLSERSTQTRIRARPTPLARRGPGPPSGKPDPRPLLVTSARRFCSLLCSPCRSSCVPPLYRSLPLCVPDGHRVPQPSTARAAQQPSGTEPVGGLHRERSGAEHVALGTTYDGALHQVPLPTAWTTKATLGDELGALTGGTPMPNRTPQLPHPAPASHPPSHPRPAPPHAATQPRGHAKCTTRWRWGRVCDDGPLSIRAGITRV